MPKCRGCGAELVFKINLSTNKRIPLVPYDPAFVNAIRYRVSENPAYCIRDNEGPLMNHFGNCGSANRFSKKNKPAGEK